MFSKYVQRCHHKVILNRNTNCAKFRTLKRAQRSNDCKLVNKDLNHKKWWLEDSFVGHYPTNINWLKKGFVISKMCMSVYRFSDRLRAVSVFCCPSSKTRDTQMTTCVTDGARRERHSSRAAALVSRVSRLRPSGALALFSLNPKKKRDCSQSTSQMTFYNL